MNKIRSIVVFLFLAFVIGWCYAPIIHIFFYNDEWRQMASVYLFGPIGSLITTSPILMVLGKGRMIGTLINNIAYAFFPLNPYPFIFFVFTGHCLNSFFLYRIITRILKDWRIGFVSGVFFAISHRHLEAFAWIGAGTEVILATFFLLLSADQLVSYVQRRNTRFLFFAFIFWYLSYLTREQTIFLLPVYLFFAFRQITQRFKLSKSEQFSFLGLSCTVFIIFAFKLFSSTAGNTYGFSGIDLWIKQLGNIVVYPFISLSQYFVPIPFIYKLSEMMIRFWYPFMISSGNNETLIHFFGSDVISGIGSLCIISLCTLSILHDAKYKIPVLIAGLGYVTSFIPIAFHLVFRYDTAIESRFLYMTTPFVAFMVGVLFFRTVSLAKKSRIIAVPLLLSLCMIWFLKEMTVTRREVAVHGIRGQEMNVFIQEMKLQMPNMPPNSVVYLESDKDYYMPNNKTPFLLGTGYVLSMLYYSDKTIPDKSIRRTSEYEEPLVQFGAEGIVKEGTVSFGYFQDIVNLKNTVIENHIDLKNIYAFRFNSGSLKIYSITEKIRSQLSNL